MQLLHAGTYAHMQARIVAYIDLVFTGFQGRSAQDGAGDVVVTPINYEEPRRTTRSHGDNEEPLRLLRSPTDAPWCGVGWGRVG